MLLMIRYQNISEELMALSWGTSVVDHCRIYLVQGDKHLRDTNGKIFAVRTHGFLFTTVGGTVVRGPMGYRWSEGKNVSEALKYATKHKMHCYRIL